MKKSRLSTAKELINVDQAWQALGLPGAPSKSCRSPFRDDRKPSFSVFNDGNSWKDHATGEGGDVVDFVAASGMSAGDACRWLIDQAGGRYTNTSIVRDRKRLETHILKSRTAPARSLDLPPLYRGSYRDVLRLQESRRLPMTAGLELLMQRGLLQFTGLYDGRDPCLAWVLLDRSRLNAQARRVDGLPWQVLPGQPKARTIKGSRAAWPIGAADLAERDVVMFCEGGPDLLAAATAAYLESATSFNRIGFVCMTGASNCIAQDALPSFAGKVIRIYQHADAAGRSAAVTWYQQLKAAGASYIDRSESDRDGEDLNDYVSRTAADLIDGTGEVRITPELPANVFAPLGMLNASKN